MKKTLLSLLALMATATTQAQDMKIFKAESLMEEKNYNEAVAVIKECISNPKTKKLALAYHLLGEINSRILNDEISNLQSGKCDTTRYINALEEAIEAFTKSNEIDQAPNDKGKVKVRYLDAFENSSLVKYSGNKKRIQGMLDYYGYAANFENQRKNQEGALKFFIKDMELPKNPVFTQEETAEIYKKRQSYYNKIGYYTAMLSYAKKDYNQVLKYVPYAIADSSSLRDGYLMKMDAHLALKDTAAWVQTVKEAIQAMPNNVANCQNLLKYYDDHKMNNEAKEMAEELVQKSPNNKISSYTKGCVYMNTLKQYNVARESFQKALNIDKDFVYAQFNMGCTFVNELMSIKDQLVTDRTKVDQYNKDMAKAREYYRKALPYFENALILAPSKAALWGYNLQTVYYNLQDGAQKELMQKKEADMKKVMEGQLSSEEFIAKYNIAQTSPSL